MLKTYFFTLELFKILNSYHFFYYIYLHSVIDNPGIISAICSFAYACYSLIEFFKEISPYTHSSPFGRFKAK